MLKESTTKNADLDQLASEIFNVHTLQESSDDLDKMFFEFTNNLYIDEKERSIATVSYFHIKKLMQCLLEKKKASDVQYVSVKFIY